MGSKSKMKWAIRAAALSVAVIALTTCSDMLASFTAMGCASPGTDPETHSVTYAANNATGGTAPATQTKTQGVDLTLATNSGSLVRTGYTFAGWNTAADGSGTDYAEGATYTGNTSLALFAKWTAPAYASPNIGTLKYVPAGTFQRDATATNTSTVSAFRMSEKEITRAQFAAMLVTDPSNATYSSGTGDPVQMTNWYDAIAFCNKLSIAEGFTPVYSVSGVNFTTLTYAAIPTASDATWDAAVATWTNTGYRLPTEMEWMWAAMGATAGTTGYTKAFAGSTGSNAIGDYAVYGYGSGQAGATTTGRSNPVGSKLPNELGLYDISGNVWEWNWDWYAAYPTGAVTDYRGAASGAPRIRRGGSWNDFASVCTVADRYGNLPSNQGVNIGFRVVRP